MNASAALQIALYAGLIPLVAALVAFFVIRSALPDPIARRYACAGGLAIGVFAGYVALPTTRALQPLQFYDWIPTLGLGAAVVGGLAPAEGVARSERGLITFLSCMLAAWFLVPDWPDLVPPQPLHVVLVGLGMFVLARLLEPLPRRLAGRAFLVWLSCAASTIALLMFVEVGETLGRLAGLGASALAGCAIASMVSQREVDMRGIVLPYAVVVGAYAFTGYVYPTTPLYPLLLVPLTPLLLWACIVGPLKQLSGAKALAAQGACVVVSLAIIAAVVLIRGSAGSDAW